MNIYLPCLFLEKADGVFDEADSDDHERGSVSRALDLLNHVPILPWPNQRKSEVLAFSLMSDQLPRVP